MVSWESAQLNITGLNTDLVNREETCPGPQNSTEIMAFNIELGFYDSITFCQKIGGQMAVAVDRETLDLMNETFSEVCGGKSLSEFYSGFTDREVEGEWRDVNTGDLLTWNNWLEGEPDGGEDFPCSMMTRWRHGDGRMDDTACARKSCPICRVKQRTKLQLTGVCSQSNIDRFYVLKSPSELLGMTFTKMIFSSKNNRWEIVDRNDKEKIFAFINQSEEIPLGKQRWYFQNNSCEDHVLNLHREVEKPGHFCCEDGSCIDSELVCNNFPDCQDGTDETNCSLLVQPGLGYKNHLPSIGIEGGKKILLSINATFTVLDIFEVNEDQSFIDILFKFKLEWFDKSLTFKFLKNSEKENTLDKISASKIWKPEIIFEVVKTETKNNKEEISISKRALPTLAKDEIVEIYFGFENNLNLQQRNRKIFICTFDNTNYPFGKAATCKVYFYLAGVSNTLTDLKPRLIDEGPTAIGQYLIEKWTIQPEIDKILGKIVVVKFVMSRSIRKYFYVDLSAHHPDEHRQPGH